MKKEFSVFGFKFRWDKVLITLGVAAGFLAILLVVDMYITSVSWYGVIIGTGFVVALWLAIQLAEYRGLPKDLPYDLIIWIFPFSIVGARIYYVLCSLNEFSNFWDVFKIWEGGMAIYGGIIGGIIGITLCCAVKKQNIVDCFDVASPCLILAQSIGRWGNFVNQEVYGLQVTNPAWQWFPFAVKVNGSYYLATFFYESLLNFIGFILLTVLLRKSKIKGIVASSYLVFYGIVRYFLEGLRLTNYILYIPSTNFPVSQAVSLVIILAGVVWLSCLLIANRRKNNNEKGNSI